MSEKEFAGLADGRSALVLDPKDNVAVALADLRAGDVCRVAEPGGGRFELTVLEDVAFGHKFALRDLDRDAPVYKYGEEIGRMRSPLKRGGWVHSHNMSCDRGM